MKLRFQNDERLEHHRATPGATAIFGNFEGPPNARLTVETLSSKLKKSQFEREVYLSEGH